MPPSPASDPAPNRRERLFLEPTCAFACPTCATRHACRPGSGAAALVAEVRALAAGGAGLLVVDGGEPARSPHLPEVVAAAFAAGFGAVELVSTGTLPEPILAIHEALRAAHPDGGGGELRVCVELPAVDPTVHEALTGAPGGLARSAAGVDRLVAAGLPVSFACVVTAANAAGLPALVGTVAARWPGAGPVRLSWYLPPRDAGRAQQALVAAPHEVEPALRAALERAAAAAVALVFDPEGAVAPCHFGAQDALAALFPPGPGLAEGERRGPCRVCRRAPQCAGPGDPRLRRGRPTPLRPVLDPRSPLLHVARDVEAAGVSFFESLERAVRVVERGDAEGRRHIPEVVIRLTDRCNLRCEFCWVRPHHQDLPDEHVQAQIRRALALAPDAVAISGGEPTLLPERLVETVRAIRAQSPVRLTLQTNAVGLAAGDLAARLATAGLDTAFVSLASHVPATFDRYTGTRGRLPLVLAGIDAALAAGLDVIVNQVVYRANLAELPDFAAFLCERFGARLVYNFSFALCANPSPAEVAALVPAYDELAGPLRAALDRLLAAGVRVAGLANDCGIPLCVLGGEPRYYGPRSRVVTDDGPRSGWRKVAACGGCALSPYCRGPRSEYVAAYGDRGVVPVGDGP